MRCIEFIVKNKFARQRRRFEFRVGLYSLLGGGMVAALVHIGAAEHALGAGSWMLTGFLAGVAFGRANKVPSHAPQSPNSGHRISDDLHALEKRGSRWTVVATILLCVAVDLSGTFAANAPGFISELGAIHRWIDSASGRPPAEVTLPPSSHSSTDLARPELIRL